MANAATDGPIADLLAQDHHVHSTFSDDASSTVAENIAAASKRGLRTICLTEHVSAATPWVDQFLETVRAAEDSDIEVLFGVEANVLDQSGRLDLPDNLPPVHRILIADHTYPGPDGPIQPAEVRRQIEADELGEDEAVQGLVLATLRAMQRTPGAQLAHLFSLLPKLGLDEDVVSEDQVRALAETAWETGTILEVNEKWACPGPAVLAEFAATGVTVVAGTSSHRATDVGVYDRVAELADAME